MTETINITKDISNFSLALCFLLLLFPFAIILYLKVEISRQALISIFRMAVQLILIGLFLEYLFKLNNNWVNIGWVLVMVIFAASSAIRNSDLKFRYFAVPVYVSFVLANFLVLLYFNFFVLKLQNILDARYLIAVGGMLLGNSLKGNIIGINHFYQQARIQENRHWYYLAGGATLREAIRPFFRSALMEALKPSLASMATMGVVFMPGIMTGQILGGTNPLLAVKYQIAIILIIFVSTTIAVFLAILFTIRTSYDGYGVLKKEKFKKGG